MAPIRRTVLSAAALVAALVPGAVWAAPPADAVVERAGAEQLRVRWFSPDPVDVYVTGVPGADLAHATRVALADRDGQATVATPATGLARTYLILRNARTGEVARVAERVIPLEAGSNFRDIGGYPAAGGRHVRWGMINRSGATPLLSAADRERIGALRLASMIDLRSDEERVLAPSRIDGVPYTAIGYSMGKMNIAGGMESVYRAMPEQFAPQLKLVFAQLLRGEQPLVYNCSAGQDRTGFVTAMVLSALGTPYPVIVSDYHLSTTYRRPEFEMPHIDLAAHPGDPAAALFARYQDDLRARQPQPLRTAEGKSYLDFAFAAINEKWGSPEGYLRGGLGLSAADIARLRARYTE